MRREDAGDGDFVQFSRAGTRATGVFRCADCGYGVTVQVHLPQCPMCGGSTWESTPAAPPAQLAGQLL
ncbi:MAG TPA: hypothetical protein VFA97_11995 [Gaiellaceae bacterium]|nr:hypothetical protein [Gaiellaceae bacterium]